MSETNRSARKRTKTLRTLFAAIEEAVGSLDFDTIDMDGVEVRQTNGGFQWSVSTSGNLGATGVLAWGPDASLRSVGDRTTEPQETDA